MFSKAIAAGISVIAISISLSSSAAADTVRLRSNDGTADLLGEFISYENTLYSIDTAYGVMLFNAEQYRCFGPACPADAVQPIDYSMSKRQEASQNLFVRVN